MTTVIYHSADYDGIFCREIAKHFLGEKDVRYIGWNFGDPPLEIPISSIYVMDLPIDRVFGFDYSKVGNQRGPQHPNGLIWIDHHKTAIDSHPKDISGYRIDGVAACRLAWQWFTMVDGNTNYGWDKAPDGIRRAGVLPMIQDFKQRSVNEPLAVRLAGEYDIWDRRDPDAETFQYGLRAQKEIPFDSLLEESERGITITHRVIFNGQTAQIYAQKMDADLVTHRSYRLKWEGLNWIVLNTGRFNSLTFAALDKPETGHDALLGYMFNGKIWTVSLYHANHRKDIDLSAIAVKYGGGGHKGACGFTTNDINALLK